MKLIRKLLAGSFVLGGFVALLGLLHAQETETPAIQAEPLSFTGRDVGSFSSFSEAQVAALASLLDETPQIPFSSLSPDQFWGNYYSLQNPDWAPLPGNIHGASVWKIGGPNNSYLLNDLDYDYHAHTQKLLFSGGMQTMSMEIPSPEDGGDDNGTN